MNEYLILGGNLICEFEGKLDSTTSMKVDEEMKELVLDDYKQVIFKLHKVDYISSAFIRICTVVAKVKGKENFIIENPNPTTMKILEIVNLKQICTIR